MKHQDYIQKMDVKFIDVESAVKNFYVGTSQNKDLLVKNFTLLKAEFHDLTLSKARADLARD